MQKKYQFLAGALLALALNSAAFAAEDPNAAIIKEAQTKARTNDPVSAREAYEKVFALSNLKIEQRVAAYMDLARVLQQAKKPDIPAAIKEYEKALAIQGIPAAERIKVLNALATLQFNSNFAGSMPSYNDDGLNAAIATYEKILADAEAPNAAKIAALSGIANCNLEKMDVKTANAALERAAALPNLTPDEKNTATLNLAKAYQRELEYEKARKLYEELLAGKPAVGLQTDLEGRIADIIVASSGKIEDGVAYLKNCKRDDLVIASFYQKNEDNESALKLLLKVLNDAQADDKLRWQAFERTVQALGRKGEFNEIRKLCETHLAAFQEKDPKRDLMNRFLGWPYTNSGVMNNNEFVAWVSQKMLAREKLAEKELLTYNGHLMNASVALGKLADAKKASEAILAVPSITPAIKMRQQLINTVLTDSDKGGDAKKAAESVLASFKPEEVGNKDRAESIEFAAKIAMKLKHYASANELDTLRDKLLTPEARRSITCEFDANGPRDISAFLASPLFNNPEKKAKLDRKYGDNLEFLLLTDSSTKGRSVNEGDAKDKEVPPTEFVVTCNADGLSLFILAPSAQLQAIADGLAGMGGYEMYLAPGEHQAYHCMLVDLPDGKTSDGFITMYNNRYFHQALMKEGTLKSETQITPKGAATLITLSWEIFYDKLPENGDKWQHDNIHWERGGYSWGGSKSVHNRSSFGDIVFANMSKENLNAIKRKIVAKAAAKYRNENQGRANGLIDFWKDPQLGDPEFYKSELAPLVEKLNANLAKVKKEMTADDVEIVFSEAVPDWMDFRYKVAELRRDYLDKLRVSGK